MLRFKNDQRQAWRFSRVRLLRVLAPLFALSQVLPAGAAFAGQGAGGFALVICTPEGVRTISWEEATGAPSPFDAPEEDRRRGAGACHGVTNDPRGRLVPRKGRAFPGWLWG
ncbi:MAG: hypothetical protein CMI63_02140 [Parvularcula sp.]|nr:hypothetical protein [Parvularcula sp.]